MILSMIRTADDTSMFRITDDTKYIQPDAANFNSWRRHIRLVGDPPDEVVHAWEDVKVHYSYSSLVLGPSPSLEHFVTSSSLSP